jgi:hypothetical protein
MTTANGFERRDPVAPLLRLGIALTGAGREGLSGRVEIRDRGLLHEVILERGAIREVLPGGTGPVGDALELRAARLFALPRPHVSWFPGEAPGAPATAIAPEPVVLGGVAARADLFEPRLLAERIPAALLHLPGERFERIRRAVRLQPEERRFLEGLTRPTPIPMLLWKRGLDPRRAGALLVALNLVGAFAGEWEPGVLPRIGVAARVLRLLRAGAEDHRLLGLPADAEPPAVERAFAALCLELHPDRLRGAPAAEVELAVEAFRGVVAARDRLRRSRRSRPVRVPDGEPLARVHVVRRTAGDGWETLTREAHACLLRGERPRAVAFALKALALSPPEAVRIELAGIVSAGRAA